MADILTPIETRRARRAITDRLVERSTLEQLLQAAHLAPSCANNQPWRFIVVDEKPTLTQIKEHLTGGNYWAKISPVIIAVASKAALDCQVPDGREYYLFGCGLASMNLMLQATELGLIAHPIAGFKQVPIKQLLDIPNDFTLITLIILGHPSDNHSHLSKKHQIDETSSQDRAPLSDVVSWNHFNFAGPEDVGSDP